VYRALRGYPGLQFYQGIDRLSAPKHLINNRIDRKLSSTFCDRTLICCIRPQALTTKRSLIHYSRTWAILLVTLVLASCAASGPLFQSASPPDSGKALVYIYRPGGFALGARDAYFYVNDKNVADLSSEGYTHFSLDPGTYNIKQKWPMDLIGFKDLDLPLVVSANRTYFYRFFSGIADSCPYDKICFKWSLQQVTESAAKTEISKCRYQAAK
jgi:hypothetical protein